MRLKCGGREEWGCVLAETPQAQPSSDRAAHQPAQTHWYTKPTWWWCWWWFRSAANRWKIMTECRQDEWEWERWSEWCVVVGLVGVLLALVLFYSVEEISGVVEFNAPRHGGRWMDARRYIVADRWMELHYSYSNCVYGGRWNYIPSADMWVEGGGEEEGPEPQASTRFAQPIHHCQIVKLCNATHFPPTPRFYSPRVTYEIYACCFTPQARSSLFTALSKSVWILLFGLLKKKKFVRKQKRFLWTVNNGIIIGVQFL